MYKKKRKLQKKIISPKSILRLFQVVFAISEDHVFPLTHRGSLWKFIALIGAFRPWPRGHPWLGTRRSLVRVKSPRQKSHRNRGGFIISQNLTRRPTEATLRSPTPRSRKPQKRLPTSRPSIVAWPATRNCLMTGSLRYNAPTANIE